MNRYDTILWDMDGTLLDTLEDLQRCVNHVLTQNGMLARSLEEVRRFVGNGAQKLMERAVPVGTDPMPLLAQFNAWYPLHCSDHTAPYPGLLPVLRTLHTAGCRMAVVSNKPDYGVKKLAQLHFPGLLDAAVGVCGTLRTKPAPDMVELAMSLLGASAERCVYIGDSDVDLRTAQNAGLPCISVLWGFRSREFLCAHGATCFAAAPQSLLSLL